METENKKEKNNKWNEYGKNFQSKVKEYKENYELITSESSVEKDILLNSISDLNNENNKFEISNIKKDFKLFQIAEIGYNGDYPSINNLENLLSSLKNEAGKYLYIIKGDKKSIKIFMGVSIDTEKDLDYSSNDICYYYLKNLYLANFEGSQIEEIKKEKLLNSMMDFKEISILRGIPSSISKENEDKEGIQSLDRVLRSMQGIEFGVIISFERASKEEFEKFNFEINKILEKLYENFSEKIIKNQEIAISDSENENLSESDNYQVQDNHTNEDSDSGSTWRKSDSHSKVEGENKNYEKARGLSRRKDEHTSYTKEYQNKQYLRNMEYFEKIFLSRIDEMQTKGCLKTSMVLLTKDKLSLDLLESSYQSMIQNNKPNITPCRFQRLNISENRRDFIEKIVNFKNVNFLVNETVKFRIDAENKINIRPLLSQVILNEKKISSQLYMSPIESAVLINIPRKEVVGISLKKNTEYGLNSPEVTSSKDMLSLGNLINNGTSTKNSVDLDLKQLDKHIFIGGVTGSGKTTTCQKLLLETGDLPFLVIEPAKREYRKLANLEKIEIYTLGNEECSNFRLNPFEFFEGELLTAHIDMLKASFTAAFSMEAAMPQIIETSIYRCYEKYGWNIDTGKNKFIEKERKKIREDKKKLSILKEDKFLNEEYIKFKKIMEKDEEDLNSYIEEGRYYPILEDMLEIVEEVINEKNMGDRLAGEYKGSIIARIESLMNGSKGQMLNTRKSHNFQNIINKKVIFELEDLKDISDKTFMMALILSRLCETLKYEYKKDSKKGVRHITLIEEAHRLLTSVAPGESENRRMAVEMFTDMLAEIRKYGESLIIVDQIPNKLASEVLKNTNTKIIHKIFAKDDKEVIGNMINLNENQKAYLSNLRVGEAIIFSQGWMKCIHTKIEMGEKLHELEESKKDYSDKEVKELMYSEKIKNNFLEPFKKLNNLNEEEISNMKFTLNSFKNIFAKSDKNALIDDIDEFKEILEELKTNDNLRLFFIVKHIERKKYKLILSKNTEVLKDEIEELNKKLNGEGLKSEKIESYSFYFSQKVISK
ncbi:ATP-binding protein [Fusobacterium polymorphum]|jgi:hypothetical protein|uniref:ATP-binding protein n=1 Tax=Fusobacterium nucleatum subsp. polymorphum TaxID=76857 RepID=UPI0030D1DA39